MRKILRIEYKDARGDAQEATVGKANVVSITEHPAAGEGDRWYYDINFDGGDTCRVFQPVFAASEGNDSDVPFGAPTTDL